LALAACTAVLATVPVRYANAQDVHTPQDDAKHHAVHLSWQGPQSSSDKMTGYNIYRSAEGETKFRKLNVTPVRRPKYDDRTVQHGGKYLYRVKSVDAKGVESGPSNGIWMTVP
jgi:fibronectin type 3 domain-containing protein